MVIGSRFRALRALKLAKSRLGQDLYLQYAMHDVSYQTRWQCDLVESLLDFDTKPVGVQTLMGTAGVIDALAG